MRGSGEKGDKANIAVTTLWGRKGDNLVLIKHYTGEKQGGNVVLVTLWETWGVVIHSYHGLALLEKKILIS